MGYYDHQENIDEYLALARGHDGAQLISVLRTHLPPQSTLLELGTGPGADLALLLPHYRVCGSDSSPLFLQHCRTRHPTADLLLLDARTIETDRQFDAIYSNKVLQHLHPDELHQSLARQRQVVAPNGILLHSLWNGSGSETTGTLYHHYYTPETLRHIVDQHFTILTIQTYREIDDNDSLYAVLQNTK